MAVVNSYSSSLFCDKAEVDTSSTCDSGFGMEREQFMVENMEKVVDKSETKSDKCEDWEEKCDSGFLESFSARCSLDSETSVKQNYFLGHLRQTADPWNFMTDDLDTYLNLCIIHNSEPMALFLISQSSQEFLNQQNTLFQTPLHLAVYLRQKNVVRALVLKGADQDVQDRNGNTACHLACHYGYLDCLHALTFPPTDEEKSFFSLDGSTALKSPNLELFNWQGVTCFHMAAVQQHFDVMNYLLTLGANINVQDNTSGRTALHMAVELGDDRLVYYLLDKGAEVDAIMYNGCSPLHVAVGRLSANIALTLCQAGADCLLPNFEDETAQDLANVNKIHGVCPFDDLKIWGQPLA